MRAAASPLGHLSADVPGHAQPRVTRNGNGVRVTFAHLENMYAAVSSEIGP